MPLASLETFGDFLRDLAMLETKLRAIVDYKNKLFSALYKAEPIDAKPIIEKCKFYAQKLLPFTIDTTEYIHGAIAEGKSILFEGAQGAMLDVDLGTYPYVTSSNTVSGGACCGAGDACGARRRP